MTASPTPAASGAPAPSSHDEVRVTRVMAAVLSQWRSILRIVVVAVVLAVGFYLLRPKHYAAVTVLVPAQTAKSDLSVLAAQLNLPMPMNLRPDGDPKRLLGAIAQSRLLADSIVRRVVRPGDVEGDAAVRKVLLKTTSFRSNTDGSIVVAVRDRNAERAAAIANEFPPLLNKLVTLMALQVTTQKLDNLNVQLNGALARLQETENRLVEFRRSGSAPVIEAQAEQTVIAAGEVQRAVMEQELKIGQMRRSMTPDNPELRAAQAELEARRQQLRRLTADRPTSGGLYVPMRSAPGIKAMELRLEREFLRDQQIYAALAGAVAQTQIDMNNNLPIVSVLDRAVVSTTPAGLKLRFLIVLGIVLGLFIALATIGWRAFWAAAEADPASRPLVDAWSDLKRSLFGWARKRRSDTEMQRVA